MLLASLFLLPAFFTRNRKRYLKAFLLPLKKVGRTFADIMFMEDLFVYTFLIAAYWMFVWFAMLFAVPFNHILLIFVFIGGWAVLGSIEAHRILREFDPDKDQDFFNLFLIFLSLWISQIAMLLSYWLIGSTSPDDSFNKSFSPVFISIYLLVEPLLILYATAYSLEAIKYTEDPTLWVRRVAGVWKRPRIKKFG